MITFDGLNDKSQKHIYLYCERSCVQQFAEKTVGRKFDTTYLQLVQTITNSYISSSGLLFCGWLKQIVDG